MTVKKTLKTLEKLEDIVNNAKFFDKLSRNEQLQISREYQKKEVLFGGLRHLKNNKPGAIIVLDGQKNYTAILEAQTIGIPVIVFGNTNTQVLPKNINNLIVFNNTSIESVKFISEVFVSSYNDGLDNAVVVKDEKSTSAKNDNVETIKKTN